MTNMLSEAPSGPEWDLYRTPYATSLRQLTSAVLGDSAFDILRAVHAVLVEQLAWLYSVAETRGHFIRDIEHRVAMLDCTLADGAAGLATSAAPLLVAQLAFARSAPPTERAAHRGTRGTGCAGLSGALALGRDRACAPVISRCRG
jgi:hypothetical protein